MWETRTGNRTLVGAEARLVSAAIESILQGLADHLSDPEAAPQWTFGIAIFDDLQPPQQLAVLNRIATHLLTDTPETLPLNAINEAAIGVLFAEIHDLVLTELETQTQLAGTAEASVPPSISVWRTLVLDALHASQSAEETADDIATGLIPQTPEDVDQDQWENVIEWLADGILWDRDYEIADCFLDAAPDKAHHRRVLLGIDDEYFTAIAPDPLPSEVPDLLSETERLTRRYPR